MPVQRRDACGHRGRMSLQMNLNIMLLLSCHSSRLCPLRSWSPCFTSTYVAHCHYVNSEACCNLPQQHPLSMQTMNCGYLLCRQFRTRQGYLPCSSASFSILIILIICLEAASVDRGMVVAKHLGCTDCGEAIHEAP